MLTIVIPPSEEFNEEKGEFEYFKGATLQLEHSLISLSRWESIWKKPFLVDEPRKDEELKSYVQCMTMTQNVDTKVYDFLTNENYKDVTDYINDPMTATTFGGDKMKNNGRGSGRGRYKFISSELIYHMMIDLEIPFSCEKWHLNRLMTLIRVRSEETKSRNGKQSNSRDIASQYAAMKAASRKPHI